MRSWGIFITAVYATILLGLLLPLLYRLGLGTNDWFNVEYLREGLPQWAIYMGLLLAGQAALLFMAVDTSWQRLRPRSQAVWSAVLAGMLTAFLFFAAGWSLAAAVFGDEAFSDGGLVELAVWLSLWALWAWVFYVYYRNHDGRLAHTMGWILKGSVLELLIAVPSHVIVRNRDDCSAPVATSFGIVTGIAIMLLCFGPGVLALYKRRLDQYRKG